MDGEIRPVPAPGYTCARLVKLFLVVSPRPSRDDEVEREERKSSVTEALNGDCEMLYRTSPGRSTSQHTPESSATGSIHPSTVQSLSSSPQIPPSASAKRINDRLGTTTTARSPTAAPP
ncbi:hypothetical protein V502_01296 [Pseudogymnoascus sp. VKM F-4520 (FW-2644)]|nr:hypothetical protein V502_01296 [Pseudogymnoascus sp. VKM F-4520 (FW-2644)]